MMQPTGSRLRWAAAGDANGLERLPTPQWHRCTAPLHASSRRQKAAPALHLLLPTAAEALLLHLRRLGGRKKAHVVGSSTPLQYHCQCASDISKVEWLQCPISVELAHFRHIAGAWLLRDSGADGRLQHSSRLSLSTQPCCRWTRGARTNGMRAQTRRALTTAASCATSSTSASGQHRRSTTPWWTGRPPRSHRPLPAWLAPAIRWMQGAFRDGPWGCAQGTMLLLVAGAAQGTCNRTSLRGSAASGKQKPVW